MKPRIGAAERGPFLALLGSALMRENPRESVPLFWKRMWSGDHPGLQNRRAAGFPVAGGFDPHSLPPNHAKVISPTPEGTT
jgi:hypothetical protein